MAPYDSEAFRYGISPIGTFRKQNLCQYGRHVEEQLVDVKSLQRLLP